MGATIGASGFEYFPESGGAVSYFHKLLGFTV